VWGYPMTLHHDPSVHEKNWGSELEIHYSCKNKKIKHCLIQIRYFSQLRESEELQDDSSGWTQQEDSLFKNRQRLTQNESKMLREGELSTHSGLFSTMLIRSPRPFLLINSLAKVESYRKIKFLFS